MYLLRSRIPGDSVCSPFNMSATMDPVHLATLVRRHREGDATVRDALISAHYRIAMSIASKYARVWPELKDDLVGEIMLALVASVDRARKALYNDDITPFLISRLHGAVCTMIRSHCRRKGKGAAPDRCKECPNLLELEVLDEIVGPLDEQDRDIVLLRVEGYTDQEIGEQLGLHTGTVCRRRSRIQNQLTKSRAE